MVTRVSDSIFEDDLTQIAKNLKKNHKHLFSVVDSEDKARKVKAELNQQGYSSAYEQQGSYFNVFYSPTSPQIKVVDDIVKNNFVHLNDNRYQAKDKSVVAGLYDYSYDDGSIWILKEIDGEDYLVKEIQNDDENDVIRQKKAVANNTKISNIDKKIMQEFKKQKLIVSKASLRDIKQKLLDKVSDDEISNVVKQYASSVTTVQSKY